ncbi:hypothetical protein HYT05_03840 [Candidatus Kaiserbacteria bacterium]|nr:hypothetical protein [Candidatus Kaiserbacteria bacterium]
MICLDTGGGSAYSAVKIMDILRSKYKKNLSIAVMEEAKSSGTLMCLAADSIVMGYISELGPLDKPMPHPEDETSTISALDIVRSFDAILDTAKDKQLTLAANLTRKFGLKRDRAVELAGKSVSDLISPLLSKQDVLTYNQALRLLKMAEVYGSGYLKRYGFKWIKNDNFRDTIVNNIMQRLIWEYPDHNFAICRNEAEDLLLSIEKAEEKDYWPELWKFFIKNIDARDKIIQFI